MTTETIDTNTLRLDVLAHLDACQSCASLLAFAKGHGDLIALDAWRRQLAQHLAADRQRRAFGHDALARLSGWALVLLLAIVTCVGCTPYQQGAWRAAPARRGPSPA